MLAQILVINKLFSLVIIFLIIEDLSSRTLKCSIICFSGVFVKNQDFSRTFVFMPIEALRKSYKYAEELGNLWNIPE